MTVTYGQIQDSVLKLIDEYSSRGAVQAANKVADYKFKIQSICNDSIMELASTTAKLPKTMFIAHNPIKNTLADDTSSIKQHLPGVDFSITFVNAKSTFLECTGPATIVIEESLNGLTYTPIESIDIPASVSTLTELRRLITPSTSSHIVRLRFSGDFVYLFRNYVLYPYTFPTEADVQQHRPWIIQEPPNDFLDLNYVEAKKDARQYAPYINFVKTPEGQLSWNSYDGPMELLVHYWRKPNLLTFTTDEAANRALVIDLRDDAAMVIPYNCAGEVLNGEEAGRGDRCLKKYAEKRINLISTTASHQGSVTNLFNW